MGKAVIIGLVMADRDTYHYVRVYVPFYRLEKYHEYNEYWDQRNEGVTRERMPQ